MKLDKTKISGIKLLLVCLFGLLATYFSDAYSASIVIVKDHQPKASIVIPDSASPQIQNAARVLQDYIQKSTGAVLPVNTRPQNNTISIHIGLTSFVKARNIKPANLDEDGFILQGVNAYNYIIIGGSDWGTEFGVYSFLERFLNVLWLMPTDIGTDIPKVASLTIPGGKIVDYPVFLSRQISPIDIKSDEALGTWGRLNRLRGRINFHSNLFSLFDPKEYYKTDPQFYSPINGKSTIPTGIKWQPNFSAAGIVDTAVAKINRYFKANPTSDSYSLGVNDGNVFDHSPASISRRKGTKNYLGLEDVSDDYFRWVNQVVEKVSAIYPGKKFGLLAYNNIAEPPSAKIGINAHVIPFLTYERMRWADDSLKNAGHKLTLDWGKMCPETGWYDYTYGYNYLIPRVWFHEMRDYLIWGSKHSVKYYYAELYPNWGEGPKPWVQSKLLWNPYLNVDSLLNVWYIRFAGEMAAGKLKQFYSMWENFWTSDILSSPFYTKSGQFLLFYNLNYLNSVSAATIHRGDALMNAAYELAGDGIQKQRVLKLKEMWQVYKMAAELYNNKELSLDEKQQEVVTSSEFITLLNNLENDSLYAQSIKNIKLSLKIK